MDAISSDSRYEWQGDLQMELIEKIKFGLDSLTDENRLMFATHIYDLLSLAFYGQSKNNNEKWEMINGRMGQYLSLYLGDNTDGLPEHIKCEMTDFNNTTIETFTYSE